MNEQTETLISIGAATAGNCIPCFEHFYFKALSIKLSIDEIQNAVDIGVKIKNGANITIKSAISDIISENHNPGRSVSDTCPCNCTGKG